MSKQNETNPLRRVSGVSRYEIVDHGIEYSDYFQGCGTAFTPYDHCVMGIGDNPAEAIEDALEMMAQGENCPDDIDAFEQEMLADEALAAWPETPSVERYENEGADMDYQYYHVSIRYSLA